MRALDKSARLLAAIFIALCLSPAAVAQGWVNPDGSAASESEPVPQSRPDSVNEIDNVIRGADGLTRDSDEAIPAPIMRQRHPERYEQERREPAPRAVRYEIPKGHMPPPGECRIWFPGRPRATNPRRAPARI